MSAHHPQISLIHRTTLFTTFWLLSISQVNTILFLYPHTIQQITPTEKIEADMLITTIIATTWTSINNTISETLSKKWRTLKSTLLIIVSLATTLLIITAIHSTINENILPKLNKQISIKKLSEFATLLLLVLISVITINSHINKRTPYIPLLILGSIISPSNPTISIAIISTILPSELIILTKKIQNKQNSCLI
uniref:Orf582 n=1 Tax=Iphiteon panicea TaxID=436082 RepID=A6YHJ0_9METZ|nr:orf582 [Iphiteon panicea]